MYKPLQIAIMFLFSFSTPLLLASCSGNNISNKIDQETDNPNKNDLISKIKDSINNKFQDFNDKNNNVFIAEKLHISDTNIQKIMNQLVNEKN